MAEIIDVLREKNPWWEGDFSLDFKDRAIYAQLTRFMGTKQILGLTGLRRVGKTTLLMKIIEDSIKAGMDPKSVMYFSFDDKKDAEVRDILKEYEGISGKSMREGRHLLVLDEVQKLPGWENQVKSIYDTYSGSTKVLVSGSESLFIRKKSKESLAGRMFEFKVNPLSFKEFLGFRGKAYDNILIREKELKRELNEYIRTEGFPELIDAKDELTISKYIYEGIVEKVLYRDIPEVFDIENIDALKGILDMLMYEPGQMLDYTGLARDFGISRQSASNYISYLHDSFLLLSLYNYSNNRRKTERKLKKYYPAILAPTLVFKDDPLYKSRVFEWLIVKELEAEFFWRDPYKHEVDIVSEAGVPVEVKYGRIDTDNLLLFMNKFGQKRGYVLSWNGGMRKAQPKEPIEIVNVLRALLGPNFIPRGEKS